MLAVVRFTSNTAPLKDVGAVRYGQHAACHRRDTLNQSLSEQFAQGTDVPRSSWRPRIALAADPRARYFIPSYEPESATADGSNCKITILFTVSESEPRSAEIRLRSFVDYLGRNLDLL